MAPTENTKLIPSIDGMTDSDSAAASSSLLTVSNIFVTAQTVLIAFFIFGTTYAQDDYDVKEYIAFRDIMAMLLLGFGYLMTFLKSYGLGAVGFTMMLSILSMEANLLIELLMRFAKGEDGDDTAWPMPVSMASLIDAEFSAATLMISFGALIGTASPLQMLVICFSQVVFYSFNKVFLVLGYIGAEDVGGSMTIHMFGAYFGLACSKALGGPKDLGTSPEPDKVSDVLALIGTTILWVFWPSFVGATETGVPDNEMRCVVNTICALLASTTMTFYLSQKLSHAKFDPVHVANSTLAGGVAIGSAARLDIGPGGAIVAGAVAGIASVYGYVFSSPYLESRFGIFDTCGVANLHGYPSLVGGLMSIIFVAMDPDADFLEYDMVSQMFRQFAGVVATLAVAISSGYATGLFVKPLKDGTTASYKDSVWWHLEY
jgi:ammonium transporter Rh